MVIRDVEQAREVLQGLIANNPDKQITIDYFKGEIKKSEEKYLDLKSDILLADDIGSLTVEEDRLFYVYCALTSQKKTSFPGTQFFYLLHMKIWVQTTRKSVFWSDYRTNILLWYLHSVFMMSTRVFQRTRQEIERGFQTKFYRLG